MSTWDKLGNKLKKWLKKQGTDFNLATEIEKVLTGLDGDDLNAVLYGLKNLLSQIGITIPDSRDEQIKEFIRSQYRDRIVPKIARKIAAWIMKIVMEF